MKVFSVAGYHHTGKTTAVVELIKELRKRGNKVVSIKDIHFEDFTMEKEDSNSWKHWEASKEVVFARGINETYQIWHKKLSLNEMLEHLSADYVVVEGMTSAALPRIICAKDEEQLEELVDGTTIAISGKYSDNHLKYKELTVYKAKEDICKLVSLVEDKVFDVLPQSDPKCCSECGTDCYGMVENILAGKKVRNDCKTDRNLKIEIKIDGKELKIVPFVQRIIRDTNLSLMNNLKGKTTGKIEITINQ